MSLTSLMLKSIEYATPFVGLSRLSAKLTDAKLGKFTQFLIKNFISTFKINLDEVANSDINSYETFNDFFIRKLKEGARPIDTDCTAVFPTDGTIGQAGSITAGRLIQAKGIDYSLKSLLGGDPKDAHIFDSGIYSCIYLSPANYHRIHMPIDGTLKKTIHIPGRLFPVGQRNIRNISDLYTTNERLVAIFETAIGEFCIIMVGAALVGSIHTTWDGDCVRKEFLIKNYDNENIRFQKGEEIGYFKYGSTVICICKKNSAMLNNDIASGVPVYMGRKMLI